MALRACHLPTQIHMFESQPHDTYSWKSVHFVFVVDESWSMEGGPWQELVNAYAAFLNRRTSDQGAEYDKVTVVHFNSTARIGVHPVPLHQAPRFLEFQGGQTAFYPAMQEAASVIRNVPLDQQLTLVFMSDGAACKPAMRKHLRSNACCTSP